MSISVNFAPETEMRLNQEALRHGSSPDVYIREIVEKALLTTSADPVAPEARRELQGQRNAATITLLEKWRAEDEAAWQNMTQEERDKEEADLQSFKNSMNENRKLSGDFRLLYP